MASIMIFTVSLFSTSIERERGLRRSIYYSIYSANEKDKEVLMLRLYIRSLHPLLYPPLHNHILYLYLLLSIPWNTTIWTDVYFINVSNTTTSSFPSSQYQISITLSHLRTQLSERERIERESGECYIEWRLSEERRDGGEEGWNVEKNNTIFNVRWRRMGEWVWVEQRCMAVEKRMGVYSQKRDERERMLSRDAWFCFVYSKGYSSIEMNP